MCRSHGRPGNITLAQFVKPAHAASHASRPPPLPSFKAPPPPPPGPPPSSVSQATSTAASKGQSGSASASEPRPNAWDQPLTGTRPLQLPGATALALAQSDSHSQVQAAVSSSGNDDGADAQHSEGQHASQKERHGVCDSGPEPSSPVQETSSSPFAGQLAECQHLPGGYASEAQHLAQIADLQASPYRITSCLIKP